MIKPGDIISYSEMCAEEGVNLQRGMNFHLQGNISVILMSLRANAPYADRVEDNGRILIYEGHDVPKTIDNPIPKIVDQPMHNPSGNPTENGKFYKAAKKYGKTLNNELVKVYEKLHRGIWVFNGIFKLVDAWQEQSSKRLVFKFRLELADYIKDSHLKEKQELEIEHNRIIPPQVKLEVWKRDKGMCVRCGSTENLHFDHIIPFSRGGSSLVAKNIQLLCAKHNIAKSNRIE